MQKIFDNILSFAHLKEKCLFCETSLRPYLTNFTGLRKDSLPVLNEYIDGAQFSFPLSHTTETYDIAADITLNVVQNKLMITVPNDTLTALLDQYVAKQALDDLRPYIDVACYNKHCKYEYYLSSSVLKITNDNKSAGYNGWEIAPLGLIYESFQTDNLLIKNDWMKEETHIYSLNNEVEPLKIMPLIDFTELGAEKLLTRIKTYAIYS